jgi:hypothetical protein
MQVLEPNDIAYSAVASSIAEDSTAAWAASTTYAKGASVRVGLYLYTSLQDSNTGHNPPDTMYGTSAYWRRTGATNRGAMFDDHLYTQSVAGAGENLVVSLPWELGTSGFAILNIDGVQEVRAAIVDENSATLMDKTYDMIEGVDNWWDYYAGAWDYKAELVELASTPLIAGTITITLSGGQPAVGHMLVGKTWEPGATLYDATAEVKDYSVYDTDDFGEISVIKRNFVKVFNGNLYLHPMRADATFRRFIKARAKSCLWMCDNRTTDEGGHESLNCFGYFKSCPLTFKGPNQCEYNLQIEGII